MKWRGLIRMVEEDGWYWLRSKGSHRIYRHPAKRNTVVVSPHTLGGDVPTGTETGHPEERGHSTMDKYVVVFERGADAAISAYTPGYPIAVSVPDRKLATEKILEAIQITEEKWSRRARHS